MSDQKERIVAVLQSFNERLSALEPAMDKLETILTKLDQVIAVQVDQNQELTTIRSRLIEESSRRGEEIHRHQRAILEHEARLYKLENARAANDAE